MSPKPKAALKPIAERLGTTVEEAAVSVIRVVDANMINALKLVSIQRGHDPREFALVVGGGGGPMHAALLGRELGVKEVIFRFILACSRPGACWRPNRAAISYGPSSLLLERQPSKKLLDLFAELRKEAEEYFGSDGSISPDNISTSHSCDMRYLGQEHPVN